MENRMPFDEFEQFLHDEVKQHRMYPSDRVWNSIRTELHGYRSWPALTFISLFIITTLTLSTVLSTQQTTHLQPLSIPNVAVVQQNEIAANQAATEKGRHYFNTLAPANITKNTIEAIEYPAVDRFAQNNIEPVNSMALNQERISHNKLVGSKTIQPIAIQLVPSPLSTNDVVASMTETNLTVAEEKNTSLVKETVRLTTGAEENDPNADDFLKDYPYQNNRKAKKVSTSKFGFQFYITPSTSYRRLSDEKVKDLVQPSVSALPVNAPLNQPSNVNEVVRHRPAVGLEVGFAVLYNISKRLKLKTGLQLNIRQYHIETYQSFTYDRATIALINFNGVENITRFSPYNNNVGYKQTELDNKVYQLAVPIGVQWEILQGKHLSLNAEASVQPTLNLNKNVYLLSTDYRHYANGNDLVRKWNINTNVGFNLSYKTGKTNWQLGPQVRYQHLPTYSNKYPIKEYLMDYGLRIGFTRSLQ